MTDGAAGATVDVTIEKLVAGGYGLARAAGGVILVDDAAPGDELTIEVREVRRGVRRARPTAVRRPGPGRREAPCPHVGTCGGCDWQHLGYEAQLEAKLDILRESLARTGRIAAPSPIRVHRSPPWAYRRRARLHRANDGRLGFRGRRSREVVALDRCPVLTPGLEAVLRGGEVHGDASGDLLDSGRDVFGAGAGRAEVEVGDRRMAVASGAFFQANLPLLVPLVERVVELAGTGARAIDLYAGVGLFALALGPSFSRVDAVEGGRAEADSLEENVRREGGGFRLHRESVETFVGREGAALAGAVVVVDPPREGLGRPVREALSTHVPERLIYVACDPVTSARDLGTLARAGLSLETVELFDLFPQTHHFEIVAGLTRAALS